MVEASGLSLAMCDKSHRYKRINHYLPQLAEVKQLMEWAQQLSDCHSDLFLQQDSTLYTEAHPKNRKRAKNKIRILTFFIFFLA